MNDLLKKFLAFSSKGLKIEVTLKDLDSPISTFGLDSLDFIEYLMDLEGEFSTKLDLDSLSSDATLNEIYRLICTSVGAPVES
jgi:acyl carrier protein